jgi:stage V sporulation protein R
MTQAERAELERWIEMIYEKALELGLDPFPVHFEVVPAHVIYELGAYALPARFSHWTFGRDYHVQKTMYEYGISRIYELVFNCDPSQAFLLDVNDMVAHKLVIAHVYGHSDFFKNNIYFEHTDRKMIERARLHAERIRHYEMVHGPLVVEQFLDAVLSVEEHIDPVLPTYGAPPRKQESQDAQPPGDTFEDLFYMAQPKPKPEPKKRKIPEEPQKDLLLFIRDHSRILEDWQRDIISMIREEMLYFLPQIKTKIINEGWACATGDSLLITSRGIMRFDALYAERQSPVSVAVGEPSASCAVLDYHCQPDTPTIRITTKRGFTIEGAHQHRVLLRDGRWVYLQDIAIGDEVALAVGTEVWSESYQPLPAPRSRSATLADVAREAGVSYYTVLRHLRGRKTLRAAAIEQALKRYNIQPTKHGRVLTTRHNLCLPRILERGACLPAGLLHWRRKLHQIGNRLYDGRRRNRGAADKPAARLGMQPTREVRPTKQQRTLADCRSLAHAARTADCNRAVPRTQGRVRKSYRRLCCSPRARWSRRSCAATSTPTPTQAARG